MAGSPPLSTRSLSAALLMWWCKRSARLACVNGGLSRLIFPVALPLCEQIHVLVGSVLSPTWGRRLGPPARCAYSGGFPLLVHTRYSASRAYLMVQALVHPIVSASASNLRRSWKVNPTFRMWPIVRFLAALFWVSFALAALRIFVSVLRAVCFDLGLLLFLRIWYRRSFLLSAFLGPALALSRCSCTLGSRSAGGGNNRCSKLRFGSPAAIRNFGKVSGLVGIQG